MSGLNPTIAGALIGGGAAVLGFAGSAWTTARAAKASRDAARELRLWDKRAEVYMQVVDVVVADLGQVDASLARWQASVDRIGQHLAGVWAYGSDEVRLQVIAFTSPPRAELDADYFLRRSAARLYMLGEQLRRELQYEAPLLKPPKVKMLVRRHGFLWRKKSQLSLFGFTESAGQDASATSGRGTSPPAREPQ